MGLYDRLTFEDGLGVSFPDIGVDPTDCSWQSKSITPPLPMLETYKITSEGRLHKEVAEYERVPEHERPHYDDELGGFESPLLEFVGSTRKIHRGWSDVDFHGIFEFHRTVDGEYVSLEAKFTDGQLVEITRND